MAIVSEKQIEEKTEIPKPKKVLCDAIQKLLQVLIRNSTKYRRNISQ